MEWRPQWTSTAGRSDATDSELEALAQGDEVTRELDDIEIRPMKEADLARVDAVWTEAFSTNTDFPARAEPPSEVELAANLDRRRHFLTHDPDGSFVAVSSGDVIGLAQALRRDSTYGLAMLAVDPSFQDRGIGQVLLHRALEYADGSTSQYIFSSSDPRAMHRYVRAGFALRPAVRMTPQQDGEVGDDTALRVATPSERDLAVVDEIDFEVRGTTRPNDVQFWLQSDVQLVLHDEGGYALFGPNRLVALCATSEEVASELLHATLCGYPDGIKRIGRLGRRGPAVGDHSGRS